MRLTSVQVQRSAAMKWEGGPEGTGIGKVWSSSTWQEECLKLWETKQRDAAVSPSSLALPRQI